MVKDNWKITLLVLPFLTACTQSPVKVEMKGSQSYTKAGSQSPGYLGVNPSYKGPPISEVTEQSVEVDSIGISDLSPPPAAEKKTPAKPEAVVSPESKNPDGTKTTVNPWTNKPRSENELEKKPHEESKQEAKIDTSSETLEPVKTEVKAEAKAKTTSSSEYKWPVSSKKILSSFGAKGEGKANDGINIAAKNGDPVWATADGEVVYVSNDLKGFGNMVLIKHAGGKTSSYSHLGKVAVDKYDRVKQGSVIGYVGQTGDVKAPQLFFSLHKGKEALDPKKYLSNEVAGL